MITILHLWFDYVFFFFLCMRCTIYIFLNNVSYFYWTTITLVFTKQLLFTICENNYNFLVKTIDTIHTILQYYTKFHYFWPYIYTQSNLFPILHMKIYKITLKNPTHYSWCAHKMAQVFMRWIEYFLLNKNLCAWDGIKTNTNEHTSL